MVKMMRLNPFIRLPAPGTVILLVTVTSVLFAASGTGMSLRSDNSDRNVDATDRSLDPDKVDESEEATDDALTTQTGDRILESILSAVMGNDDQEVERQTAKRKKKKAKDRKAKLLSKANDDDDDKMEGWEEGNPNWLDDIDLDPGFAIKAADLLY